ncbi:MAG: CBS domain-containing protein [Methanocellales archaeon]|nr:CBS domain-containing protein [Methanocellales archaeon]MDI6903563.1 CBS domain-containing protein [Methanocellales archaeon]
MLPTHEDLKRRRESLRLTQSELAMHAGVSQALIARIESGDVDPRLSTLRKIVKVLDEVERKIVTAREIMHSPVIHVSSCNKVSKAVDIMETHDFSQVPVIDDGVPVGSISESVIVQSMSSERDIKKISDLEVGKLMEESFPTVSPSTGVDDVSHLLEHHPAVLVLERGNVVGVITKHDVMKLLHKS